MKKSSQDKLNDLFKKIMSASSPFAGDKGSKARDIEHHIYSAYRLGLTDLDQLIGDKISAILDNEFDRNNPEITNIIRESVTKRVHEILKENTNSKPKNISTGDNSGAFDNVVYKTPTKEYFLNTDGSVATIDDLIREFNLDSGGEFKITWNILNPAAKIKFATSNREVMITVEGSGDNHKFGVEIFGKGGPYALRGLSRQEALDTLPTLRNDIEMCLGILNTPDSKLLSGSLALVEGLKKRCLEYIDLIFLYIFGDINYADFCTPRDEHRNYINSYMLNPKYRALSPLSANIATVSPVEYKGDVKIAIKNINLQDDDFSDPEVIIDHHEELMKAVQDVKKSVEASLLLPGSSENTGNTNG